MQLVYLCPVVRKPVGGVKVIYAQAFNSNKLLDLEHKACVLHPNTWRHRDKWFDNGVDQMRAWFKPRWVEKPSLSSIGRTFDPKKHSVIIPELWVRKYGNQLLERGVNYGIFVQAGYYLNKGDPAQLTKAYNGAKAILSISDDTTKCINTAFPGNLEKIIRLHLATSTPNRINAKDKVNEIVCLSNKHKDQASKLEFFLKPHLPTNWRFTAIDKVPHTELMKIFDRSKIFISLQFQEGFGLPPLEAALRGNVVIGSTGQGALEYWHPAIFSKTEPGNLIHIIDLIKEKCAAWDKEDQSLNMKNALNSLRKRYNSQQEQSDLKKFIKAMDLSLK